MAEYNVDEYNVEGEDTQYNFKISLVDDKINLQLTEISENQHGKNYEGEFTLEELRQINRVFHLTNTIYDAQEEFKKAVERQKIALSENEAYVNIMFHMVLGTDNSPFVIALPRNESARIMKLEQDSDMLKLERDNLFDKLEIIKRNTNEILQSTTELEEDNENLKNMTKKVEEEMSLATPAKPVNPPQVPTSNKPIMGSFNEETSEQNMSRFRSQQDTNNSNNMVNSTNMNNMNNINNLNNMNSINMKASKAPNQQMQNKSMNPNNLRGTKPQPQKTMVKRFKCGIISNILKNENEIFNVSERIHSYLKKNFKYNLIFFSKVDGDKATTFHKKCDKAKRSLVLIMDNNGNRFGGFTMRDWAGNCIQKKDEKAFIFSLDKNKIYGVLPDQVAIGCYPTFGPIFFGCQIRVYDNFFKKGGSTYLKGLNYATEEDYELTNGNQAFGIKELEVYEIKDAMPIQ